MRTDPPIWQTSFGVGPLIATAVHDGHAIRSELVDRLALDEAGRLREEDPFTARWTDIAATRIVGLRSRFELDLNRPREKAIYCTPEDCWGLTVWQEPLLVEVVERSRAAYDAFYTHVRSLLAELAGLHGRVVVFDLHSYNHRRDGADGELADPEANPEINLGTGTMDRDAWAPIVERCLAELRAAKFAGRALDVRENVRFFGGHFPRWIHEHFPGQVCVLSIECKKIFMDEWTGELDEARHADLHQALHQAAAGVLEALEAMP